MRDQHVRTIAFQGVDLLVNALMAACVALATDGKIEMRYCTRSAIVRFAVVYLADEMRLTVSLPDEVRKQIEQDYPADLSILLEG